MDRQVSNFSIYKLFVAIMHLACPAGYSLMADGDYCGKFFLVAGGTDWFTAQTNCAAEGPIYSLPITLVTIGSAAPYNLVQNLNYLDPANVGSFTFWTGFNGQVRSHRRIVAILPLIFVR